jgi:hypothetical protein
MTVKETFMLRLSRWTFVMIVALMSAPVLVGCSDKPHSMGRERPPVDELYGEDRGLQSKDVVSASDLMAQSLLSDPRLNGSKEQWVMVVDRVQMDAVEARGDLDIFLRRLKVNLDKFGKGRVTFVENRDKLRELQSRELDGPKDTFGQGAPARLQPDYALYCRVSDLPNRGTNYYFFEFTVTNFGTGVQAWTDAYEVRVRR